MGEDARARGRSEERCRTGESSGTDAIPSPRREGCGSSGHGTDASARGDAVSPPPDGQVPRRRALVATHTRRRVDAHTTRVRNRDLAETGRGGSDSWERRPRTDGNRGRGRRSLAISDWRADRAVIQSSYAAPTIRAESAGAIPHLGKRASLERVMPGSTGCHSVRAPCGKGTGGRGDGAGWRGPVRRAACRGPLTGVAPWQTPRAKKL